MQISNLTIFMLGLNVFLGLAIPVGLFIWCRLRYQSTMIPYWAGCGTFILFAMVLESAVHQVVLLGLPIGAVIQGNTWLYALYGGLMAGLFEETGRFCAMKLLKRRHNRPATALIYGAGHGGIEVLIVLGLNMVNYLVYAILANRGQLTILMPPELPEASRQALLGIVESLSTQSPWLLLLSPLERISAVILHMSLSVFVWKAAAKPGRFPLFFAAIALHALMDALAVILSGIGLPTLVLEGIILLFALGTAWLAKRIY